MNSRIFIVTKHLRNFLEEATHTAKHKKKNRFSKLFAVSAIALALLSSSLAPVTSAPATASNILDLNYGYLSFQPEPDFLRVNSNLVVGFSHHYSNVAVIGGQAVDARVTLNYVTGHLDGEIASFDQYDNTQHLSFHTQVDGSSTAQASARVKIEFFEGGTFNPVVLSNIRASISDLDVNEFARFYSISNYSFSSPTSLSVQTSPTPPVGETTFVSSASSTNNADQSRIVQVNYSAASAISIMFGCRTNSVSVIGSNGLCGFTIDMGTPVFTGATTIQNVAQPTYTITYDANTATGAAPASETVSSTTTISSPINLTKPGYTFAGWTSNSDGTGILLDPGDSYVASANITLYAKWVPDATPTPTPTPTASANPAPHTVNFMSNGGAGTMTDQTSSTPASLSSNSFTRSGYDFVGWNTAADGSGTNYPNASSYNFSADLTLYAIWSPSSAQVATPTPSATASPSSSATLTPHTVFYLSNGGTGTMNNQTSSVASNLSTNLFSRSGYTFAGWNTSADGSGTTYADASNYAFAANLTLYALWIPLSVEPESVSPAEKELAYTGAADMSALLIVAFALFVAGVAIRFAPSPKRRR